MTVREFIQQIADGTLHYRNDIVNSIPVSWDKTDLVNDMFYYDRVEDPKTGAIPVLNDVEKQRLYNAIKFIYDLYQQEISYFPIWELSGEDLSDMPNSVEASTIQIVSDTLCEFDHSPGESVEDPFNNGDSNILYDHYNSGADDRYLMKVFCFLRSDGYIDENTDPKQWIYVCKGTRNDQEYKAPILWNKQQNKLSCLIHYLFVQSDFDRIWKIAENAFKIKKRDGYVKPKNEHLSSYYQKDTKPIQEFEKKLKEL